MKRVGHRPAACPNRTGVPHAVSGFCKRDALESGEKGGQMGATLKMRWIDVGPDSSMIFARGAVMSCYIGGVVRYFPISARINIDDGGFRGSGRVIM